MSLDAGPDTLENALRLEFMVSLLSATQPDAAYSGPLEVLCRRFGAARGLVQAIEAGRWTLRASQGLSLPPLIPTPLQLERLRSGERLYSVQGHHPLQGCAEVVGVPLLYAGHICGLVWLGFAAPPRLSFELLEELLALWSVQLERFRQRQAPAPHETQPVAAMRQMLDLAPALLGTLDLHGTLLNLNRASERLLGYRPDELLGRNLLGLGFPEDRPWLERELRGLLKPSSTPSVRELRLRHALGHEVWLEWSVSAGPEAGRLYAVARDLTEERRFVLELERSEARFRSLTQHSSDLVTVVDREGTLRFVSASVERLLGYSGERALDRRIFDYIHPEDAQVVWSLFSSLLAGESVTATFRFRRQDGSWCWLDAVGSNRLDDPHVGGFVINARDAGERKTVEAHITSLNARLERQVQRLTTLHAIDVSIASGLDLGATLDLLLEQTRSQLGVDAAAILLFNSAFSELDAYRFQGFRTDLFAQIQVPLGHSIAGRVALERQVRGLERGDNSIEHALFWQAEGFVDYQAAPLLVGGELLGVLEVFHRGKLETDAAWLEFLQALAGQAAIAVQKSSLLSDLQATNAELIAAYDATIEGWAKALELRDFETEGHSRRVTLLSLKLARRLGLAGEALEHLRRGALLHDIGKMGIPDGILLKQGPLEAEEWLTMRQHPTHAYALLFPVGFLRPALDIPHAHHEKWDGSGYPRGLKAEQIPRAARVFAVVDVFDALSSDRPYRLGWERDKVLSYLRQSAGSHFDPQVVAAFLEMIEQEGDWLFEDETVYFEFPPLPEGVALEPSR